MPGNPLELVEAAKISGERIVVSRAGPPIFLFRRRRRISYRDRRKRLEKSQRSGRRSIPRRACGNRNWRPCGRRARDGRISLAARASQAPGSARTACWTNRPNEPLRCNGPRPHACREQHTARIARARKAQITAHRQRLDDIDGIFVLHVDIARGGQCFLQHCRARASAGNHEESLGFSAHGLTAITIASRPKPAFANVR